MHYEAIQIKYYLISLLIPFLLFIPSFAYGADWYDSDWNKARGILTSSGDFDSTLTDYPVYVNITEINIGTDTQADCDDIVFTNFQNTSKLSHEIETCDTSGDVLEAWVKLPNAYSNGTQFFMYYDNSGASDQQSTEATWNSNFKGVWHVNGTFLDSTSNDNTCTNSGTSAATDEYIGDSRHYDGADDYLDCGTTTSITNIFDGGGTISMWYNKNNDGEFGGGRLERKSVGSSQNGHLIFMASTKIRLLTYFSTLSGFWDSTSAPSNNVWHHLMIKFNDDSSSNNPTFSHDGNKWTVGSGLT